MNKNHNSLVILRFPQLLFEIYKGEIVPVFIENCKWDWKEIKASLKFLNRSLETVSSEKKKKADPPPLRICPYEMDGKDSTHFCGTADFLPQRYYHLNQILAVHIQTVNVLCLLRHLGYYHCWHQSRWHFSESEKTFGCLGSTLHNQFVPQTAA